MVSNERHLPVKLWIFIRKVMFLRNIKKTRIEYNIEITEKYHIQIKNRVKLIRIE